VNIELFLYLADVLPWLGQLCVIIGIIGAGLAGVCLVERAPRKVTGIAAIIALLLLFAGVAIPSKQTIYLMAGANVAKQAMNSSVDQKVQQLFENELDNFLKDKK